MRAAVGIAGWLMPRGRGIRIRAARELAVGALGEVACRRRQRRRRRRRRRGGRCAVPPGLAPQAGEEPVAARLVIRALAGADVGVVGSGDLKRGVQPSDPNGVGRLQVHMVLDGHVGEGDLRAVLLDEVDLHHALLLLLAEFRALPDDGAGRVVLADADARGPDGDPLVVRAVVHVYRQAVDGQLASVRALERLCVVAHVHQELGVLIAVLLIPIEGEASARAHELHHLGAGGSVSYRTVVDVEEAQRSV